MTTRSILEVKLLTKNCCMKPKIFLYVKCILWSAPSLFNSYFTWNELSSKKLSFKKTHGLNVTIMYQKHGYFSSLLIYLVVFPPSLTKQQLASNFLMFKKSPQAELLCVYLLSEEDLTWHLRILNEHEISLSEVSSYFLPRGLIESTHAVGGDPSSLSSHLKSFLVKEDGGRSPAESAGDKLINVIFSLSHLLSEGIPEIALIFKYVNDLLFISNLQEP